MAGDMLVDEAAPAFGERMAAYGVRRYIECPRGGIERTSLPGRTEPNDDGPSSTRYCLSVDFLERHNFTPKRRKREFQHTRDFRGTNFEIAQNGISPK